MFSRKKSCIYNQILKEKYDILFYLWVLEYQDVFKMHLHGIS